MPSNAWDMIGGGLTAGLGAGVVFAGFWAARRVAASTAWPTATGTVIESAVEWDRDGYWKPRIVYEYTAFGARRTGRGLGLTGEWGINWTDSIAKRTAANYPVGAPVVVYWDPANPEISLLERSVVPARLIQLLGVAIMLAGVLWAIMGRDAA